MHIDNLLSKTRIDTIRRPLIVVEPISSLWPLTVGLYETRWTGTTRSGVELWNSTVTIKIGPWWKLISSLLGSGVPLRTWGRAASSPIRLGRTRQIVSVVVGSLHLKMTQLTHRYCLLDLMRWRVIHGICNRSYRSVAPSSCPVALQWQVEDCWPSSAIVGHWLSATAEAMWQPRTESSHHSVTESSHHSDPEHGWSDWPLFSG